MGKLNIHYLQHVPFEGLGIIEEWINEKGHKLTSTHFYENAVLPEIDAVDWLIIMGGPMGVYDEDTLPWLKLEKQFIAKAIENKKVVLGICLGAQLIAEVLGAKVYPNTQKEIGWFPIQISAEARKDDLFNFLPQTFSVFHWHGDTFDLPEGAVHLAESTICKNQAFKYTDRVIGLQFHFEVDAAAVKEMVYGADDELIKGQYVQTGEEILKELVHTEENNKIMREILDRLALLK